MIGAGSHGMEAAGQETGQQGVQSSGHSQMGFSWWNAAHAGEFLHQKRAHRSAPRAPGMARAVERGWRGQELERQGAVCAHRGQHLVEFAASSNQQNGRLISFAGNSNKQSGRLLPGREGTPALHTRSGGRP